MLRSSHRLAESPLLLAALAGLATALPALGQTRTWLGGSGSWAVPGNWTPSDVPDTLGESAAIAAGGIYTLSLPTTVTLDSFSMTNTTARIDTAAGTEFRIAGASTNNGLVVINATGAAAGTYYRSITSHALSGTGTLRLNANPANLDTSAMLDNGGAQVFTNGASHTVAGTGRIYGNFVNNSLVSADITTGPLQMYLATKTNNATMRAIAGAQLDFSGPTVNQGASGLLLADGGLITFCGAAVNNGALSVINGGLARVTCTSNFDSLSASGPWSIDAGNEARISGALSNGGTLTVNGSAANAATYLRNLSSYTLSGGGVIALNANSANLDTAAILDNGGGQLLTNANNTIRGTGRIYGRLTNNGLVSADINAQTLQLYTSTKTNNSTMRAVNGGNLDLSGCTLNQGASGVVLADAGLVSICGAAINGGAISSVNGGLSRVTCTSSFDSVFASGPWSVDPGIEARVSTALSNSGTLTLNPPGTPAGTYYRVLTSHTISGGGTIVLNANPSNLDTAAILDNGGGQVLTNANNTIRGTGRIYSHFTNDGLVVADLTGLVLDLSGSTKTNRAVLRSTNGATLSITGLSLNQSTGPGSVQAVGGLVTLNGVTVTGGSMSATGAGGLNRLIGTSTLQGVTLSGPFEVMPSTELHLNTASGITNNGTITVNPSGAAAGTLVRALSSNTISGTGQLILNAHPSNLDTAYLYDNGGGQVTTNGASHTIRGTGRIYSNFTNNGAVLADVASRTLQLIQGTKTNNATMTATGGGSLDFSAVTLNQGASGLITVDAGSFVTFCGSTMNNGTLTAMPGGEWRVTCTSTINDTILNGVGSVMGGLELRTGGGFTNHGVLTINRNSDNAGTLLRATSSCTIDGSGELRLNANPANYDTAYLSDNGGGQLLTNGSGHTISGRGRFYCRLANSGVLSPGIGVGDAGLLQGFQPITCTASSDIRIDIAGPGTNPATFDRVTSTSAVTLNGTLYARAVGYSPGYGETFDIITGSTRVGTFSGTDTKGFQVDYLPNGVRLTAICDPDVSDDGNVDQDDVTYLINVISGGDNPTGIDPDFNHDGNADQDDIVALINVVAGAPCG